MELLAPLKGSPDRCNARLSFSVTRLRFHCALVTQIPLCCVLCQSNLASQSVCMFHSHAKRMPYFGRIVISLKRRRRSSNGAGRACWRGCGASQTHLRKATVDCLVPIRFQRLRKVLGSPRPEIAFSASSGTQHWTRRISSLRTETVSKWSPKKSASTAQTSRFLAPNGCWCWPCQSIGSSTSSFVGASYGIRSYVSTGSLAHATG
mmetsp:Transcript_21734/g.47535  ORF Transcript_21734/g.47535 Transcript_21734/m.47535 type:complete len:206 (+) Transcript_21734:151-768(+)